MDIDNLPELSIIWDEARNLIKAGDHNKAIEVYNYILVRYSDDVAAIEYAHAYLSDIYLTLRQIDLAEEHIRKALKYNPEKPDYHYILGFIYTYKRLWKKAIAEFGIAVTEEPDDVEFIRGLGSATWMGGNREKGLALLHRANAMAPKNVNVLIDLAVAYLDSDIDRARKYAEMAMVIEHGNSLVKKVWNKIKEIDGRAIT